MGLVSAASKREPAERTGTTTSRSATLTLDRGGLQHDHAQRPTTTVFRLPYLFKAAPGGAWRRRAALCPMQPEALARGVRPPAGPRAARDCLHGAAARIHQTSHCSAKCITIPLVTPCHYCDGNIGGVQCLARRCLDDRGQLIAYC